MTTNNSQVVTWSMWRDSL